MSRIYYEWKHACLEQYIVNDSISVSTIKQKIKTLSIIYWRTQWHPTPVLLPGKSHGWRSLVGCSPWGHTESNTTEWLHFHYPLSCIGEGNGNPLQCSCLENPRDRWAWWVAVYGVAQSRTRLKWLSSNLSMIKVSKQNSLSGWINFKKQHLTSCCLKETHFSFRDTQRLKVKRWEKIFHANRKQKKP